MQPTVLASTEVVSLASSLLGEADPRKIKRFVFTEVKYDIGGFSTAAKLFVWSTTAEFFCFIIINIIIVIFNSYPTPTPGPSHHSVVFVRFVFLVSPPLFLGRKTTTTTKQNKTKKHTLNNGDLGRSVKLEAKTVELG